jgi:porin
MHVLFASVIGAAALTARADPNPDEPTTEPVQESVTEPATAALLSESQPPTDPGLEIEEIAREQEGSISVPPAERPLQFLTDRAAELEEATGLRVGMAYTMLFQQATGGQGHRTGAAGDIDLLAKWTLLGRGTKNTGQLVFASEYRHQIGSHTPSDLSGEIGTLLGTTNGFTERTVVVKELYWVQRLFEDRLRIGVGRADPENLVGGHRLQSQNTAFLNKAFSTNPTIAYPGSGTTAGVSVRPVEWFYATVGAVNADARTTTIGVEELFGNWNLFTFAEAGFTPTISELGAGRYRVAAWHIDEREDAEKPEDQGISIILEQDFGGMWQAFARYGYADAEVSGVRHLVEGGFGVKGLLGSKDNLTGVAIANANPQSGDTRDETVVEAFHRWQVTAQSQFTVGAQAIISPGNAPDDDVLGVFSVRLRLSF